MLIKFSTEPPAPAATEIVDGLQPSPANWNPDPDGAGAASESEWTQAVIKKLELGVSPANLLNHDQPWQGVAGESMIMIIGWPHHEGATWGTTHPSKSRFRILELAY